MLKEKESLSFILLCAILAGVITCIWFHSTKAFAIAVELNIFGVGKVIEYLVLLN